MILVFLACAQEDSKPNDTDPCASAPTVSYNNFGQSFFIENCQSCHASTQTDREGAPEEIVFDSEADIWALADRILARAAATPPTMPPQGGTSDDDRELLQIWLGCGQ